MRTRFGAKAVIEEVAENIHAVTQLNTAMKLEVNSARRRIPGAERKQRLAKTKLAQERVKTAALRNSKKNKYDFLRYFEQQTTAARAEEKHCTGEQL